MQDIGKKLQVAGMKITGCGCLIMIIVFVLVALISAI